MRINPYKPVLIVVIQHTLSITQHIHFLGLLQLSYTHIQYKCVLTLYNIKLLGAGIGGRKSYMINVAVIQTSSIYPNMVGPHVFEDTLPFTFQLSCRIDIVEYVPLVFLTPFFSHIVWVPLWQVHLYCYNKLILSFDDLNVRWLVVNNYICSIMFSNHVRK